MSAALEPVSVTTATFTAEVLEISDATPVLVDFWAPWCGPCKQLMPLLDKIHRDYGGRFRLAKLNTDEHPEIPQQLGIKSLPTVVLFKERRVADHFVGVVPEAQIRELLDRHVPAASETPLARAVRLKKQGDFTGARILLEKLRQDTPTDIGVQGELAEVLLASGEVEAARAALDDMSAREPNHRAVKRLAALLAFSDVIIANPHPEQLITAIAASPDNLDLRHALAAHQLLSGEHEPALEFWLTLMREKRSWRDDLGRKSLVQAFEIAGEDDPLVARTRREMARLLF